MLLGIFKEVPDSRSADAHEHLHEIRTGYGEKRHAGFSRHRLCDQRLAGTGRSDQNHALGNSGAEPDVFIRILQEIHDLHEVLLLFLKACHFVKGDGIVAAL